MNRNLVAGLLAGAITIGGGTALVLPSIVHAADPAASATTTTPTTTGGSTTAPADRHGGPGGLDADDLTAAAKALGMTEADLTTALQSGKTPAQLAADKGVDVQAVIDAIVASDKAEFADAVKAGTMTQAQADQLIANLSAHVTDEVNGVAGGPGGRGGHDGGHGPDGQAPAAPGGSSSSNG